MKGGKAAIQNADTSNQARTRCLPRVVVADTHIECWRRGRKKGGRRRLRACLRHVPPLHTHERAGNRETARTKQAAPPRALLAQPGCGSLGNGDAAPLHKASERQLRHTPAEGRENSMQTTGTRPSSSPSLPRQYVHLGAEWGR